MAPISTCKLVYFNGRGRAEHCRWVLHQAGVQFEDYRLKDGEWATMKPNSPTTMAPFAEIDGKTLASSNAISVYVAKQYGMFGANDWEAAEIHMSMDLVGDTLTAVVKYMFCKDEAQKEELKKAVVDTALPRLLNFISKRLEGGKQWLVGEKLSLADITVAQFLTELKDPDMKAVLDANAASCGLVQRVTDQPNIKKWIDSRPESSF